MNINDNITVGSYVFEVNPNKYSVAYIKLKTSRRSLNGTLHAAYVMNNDNPPKVVTKAEFTIGGISFDQLDFILAEFLKNENLAFVDITGTPRTVQFDDYGYDIDSADPNHPTYSIKLSEV